MGLMNQANSNYYYYKIILDIAEEFAKRMGNYCGIGLFLEYSTSPDHVPCVLPDNVRRLHFPNLLDSDVPKSPKSDQNRSQVGLDL